MPTEQRRHMPQFHLPAEPQASFLTDERRPRAEREVEFFKQGCFPEHDGRFSLILGSKSVASSPLQMLKPIGAKVVDRLDDMQPNLMEQNTPCSLEDKPLGQKNVNLSPSSWRADQDLVHQHDSFSVLALPLEGRRGDLNGTQYESGLFSSSLPDIFDKKIRLTPKNSAVGQLVGKFDLNCEDAEPFQLTKEIEVQIIGNLLPDDDDLLSGALGDVGYTAQTNYQDDIDDDIFYTGGGMELEVADENKKLSEVNDRATNGHIRLIGQQNGEHTYGQQPSRVLFVRSIDSNVEDSEVKLIFEKYGDIHMINTSCKHHGFVMISYYDVRSAENAMKALQSKPLGHRKLDIHYYTPKDYPSDKHINQGTVVVINLDPPVTNDDLHRIFGVYGEIKEIHNTSGRGHHKSIEFYDVRAAEAARQALHRSDISGKKIILDPNFLGGTKRLMQQMPCALEPEGFGVCKLGSPNPNSPSSYFGSINMASIRSTGPESGTVQGLCARVHTPINQYGEGKNFLDLPPTLPNISSPVGIATAGAQRNHYTLNVHNHSLGNMNGQNNGKMDHGFQEINALHPHSLPEINSRLSNGIPYNLSTIPPIIKSNSRYVEATDGRHIYKGSSGNLRNHSSAHTEVLGFSRSGSCPQRGHQLARSNSSSLHQQPSSPVLWPSTGLFVNNMSSRPLMQVHGISRMPSCMLENTISKNHHTVGSAPAVNPSIWDRRHGYGADMMEASGFHPGSAGTMGFSGSPNVHSLGPSSMFPHNGGTFMDSALPPAHIVVPSPQQRGHMFHRRSHMAPIPSAFDSPGERTRSRRNELNTNQSDNRRLYELDIESIVRGEDSRTTLMIKNIPNKYTSKMLLAAIDESHKGTYDFIYLPIDFKNKCNVGYAFINMISPEHIVPFYKTFNGKRWEKFNSEKVASLAYARIQGKSALIVHFQNSSLMNEDKRCRPILFHSDGPNAGDQEPFPVGTNVRTRPGRSRILSYEENHRDVLSAHPRGESPPIKCGATPGYTTREADQTSAA